MAEEVNKAKLETESVLKKQVLLEKAQSKGKDSSNELKKLKDDLT